MESHCWVLRSSKNREGREQLEAEHVGKQVIEEMNRMPDALLHHSRSYHHRLSPLLEGDEEEEGAGLA